MSKQLNARLPEFTHEQLERLAVECDMTKTQVLIIAIDRLARELRVTDAIPPVDESP